jgi:sensor histidine kinase YesM
VHLVVVGSIYWFTTGRNLGIATSLANQVQRFFGNFFLEAVVTYAGAAGVLVAIDFARAVRDKEVSRARLEKQAVELEASLAKARLDALRMELNPHFLFNTLSAISGLVGQDRKGEAREVIGRLGELLRRALDGGQEPFSTVERELELLQDYLYIQRLRFHDRLSIHQSLDDSARECLIPSMLLLQLVENAVRHGIEPLEGHGTVTIQIDRVSGSVRIAIRDTGVGFVFRDDQGLVREGIGISNTRARLEHVYGDRAALLLQNRDQGGAEAIVVIPALSNSAPPRAAALPVA